MSILSDFKNMFKVTDLKIFETDYWIWSLRPQQATIGSGVLSLKRYCQDFDNLEEEEFTDLNNIIKVIEPALRKSFDYDKINYLMLMMVDNHIHYHVIPRFEREIEMFDKKWVDKGWPKLPVLSVEESNIEELNNIKNFIQNNL